ncbi:unnamed protein product [Amoebophrya sp. A120]|nr:unnamed protein product [Amoebophrya sp. A120]|eukprot:GSA120T00012336001.1
MSTPAASLIAAAETSAESGPACKLKNPTSPPQQYKLGEKVLFFYDFQHSERSVRYVLARRSMQFFGTADPIGSKANSCSGDLEDSAGVVDAASSPRKGLHTLQDEEQQLKELESKTFSAAAEKSICVDKEHVVEPSANEAVLSGASYSSAHHQAEVQSPPLGKDGDERAEIAQLKTEIVNSTAEDEISNQMNKLGESGAANKVAAAMTQNNFSKAEIVNAEDGDRPSNDRTRAPSSCLQQQQQEQHLTTLLESTSPTTSYNLAEEVDQVIDERKSKVKEVDQEMKKCKEDGTDLDLASDQTRAEVDFISNIDVVPATADEEHQKEHQQAQLPSNSSDDPSNAAVDKNNEYSTTSYYQDFDAAEAKLMDEEREYLKRPIWGMTHGWVPGVIANVYYDEVADEEQGESEKEGPPAANGEPSAANNIENKTPQTSSSASTTRISCVTVKLLDEDDYAFVEAGEGWVEKNYEFRIYDWEKMIQKIDSLPVAVDESETNEENQQNTKVIRPGPVVLLSAQDQGDQASATATEVEVNALGAAGPVLAATQGQHDAARATGTMEEVGKNCPTTSSVDPADPAQLATHVASGAQSAATFSSPPEESTSSSTEQQSPSGAATANVLQDKQGVLLQAMRDIKSKKPKVSLFLVRYFDYWTDKRRSEYKISQEWPMFSLFEHSGVKACFGTEFEAYQLFVKNEACLANFVKDFIGETDHYEYDFAKKILKADTKVGLYYLWPCQQKRIEEDLVVDSNNFSSANTFYKSTSQYTTRTSSSTFFPKSNLMAGMVEERKFFDFLETIESTEIQTRYPAPASLYRQLCGKQYYNASCLQKSMKVPATCRVFAAAIRKDPVRAAENALATLNKIRETVWDGKGFLGEDLKKTRQADENNSSIRSKLSTKSSSTTADAARTVLQSSDSRREVSSGRTAGSKISASSSTAGAPDVFAFEDIKSDSKTTTASSSSGGATSGSRASAPGSPDVDYCPDRSCEQAVVLPAEESHAAVPRTSPAAALPAEEVASSDVVLNIVENNKKPEEKVFPYVNSGVVKLGFSWMGVDVEKFDGVTDLAEKLTKMINRSEGQIATSVLVQELVPHRVAELRIHAFCVPEENRFRKPVKRPGDGKETTQKIIPASASCCADEQEMNGNNLKMNNPERRPNNSLEETNCEAKTAEHQEAENNSFAEYSQQITQDGNFDMKVVYLPLNGANGFAMTGHQCITPAEALEQIWNNDRVAQEMAEKEARELTRQWLRWYASEWSDNLCPANARFDYHVVYRSDKSRSGSKTTNEVVSSTVNGISSASCSSTSEKNSDRTVEPSKPEPLATTISTSGNTRRKAVHEQADTTSSLDTANKESDNTVFELQDRHSKLPPSPISSCTSTQPVTSNATASSTSHYNDRTTPATPAQQSSTVEQINASKVGPSLFLCEVTECGASLCGFPIESRNTAIVNSFGCRGYSLDWPVGDWDTFAEKDEASGRMFYHWPGNS